MVIVQIDVVRASFFVRSGDCTYRPGLAVLSFCRRPLDMLTFNSSAFLKTVNNLSNLSAQLALSNERLTTGRRINHASDDPSGVIAVAQMESDIAEIDAAISNGERINSIIDVADGAMSQISSLLGTIQTKP